jgi:UPF0271 protein
MAQRVDLNADVGESFGPWPMGDDAALFPLVTSVNVACGFHAGDPTTIVRTVEQALAAGLAVGAHPGYPDLVGFGRRDLAMTAVDLEAAVLYQVSALDGIVRARGVRLSHVKPHGALYNRAARDLSVAGPLARAVAELDRGLRFVGPPGSAILEAARAAGLAPLAEAFADRAYEPDGALRSRQLPGAVIDDPAVASRQAVSIAVDREVTTTTGSLLAMPAETICLHSDTPGAAANAAAVRAALESHGVEVVRVGG